MVLPQGTIRYRERGNGEPIVFVHGLLVNGDLWRKVVPTLAKDFRCITPDWPLGSHEVPMNPDADLTPTGLAKLVADFLAALELENVTLVGNDTGGALSQIVVTEHPERIARLVLTPCDAFEVFPPRLFKYLSARRPHPRRDVRARAVDADPAAAPAADRLRVAREAADRALRSPTRTCGRRCRAATSGATRPSSSGASRPTT